MPSEYNPNLIASMEAKFRRLNNPAHAMADAVGMLQMFPGLVGLWPGSGVGGGSTVLNAVTDKSGNGLHLSTNGNARIAYPSSTRLFSVMSFDGTNSYFSHADAAIFDITGADLPVAAAQIGGVTIGGWFYATDATPAATMALIGKSNTPSNTSYWIRLNTGGTVTFDVSTDGSTIVSATSAAISDATWYFVVGRFTPSTSMSIRINGTVVTNSTSIPATLFNSNAPFQIGARQSGGVAANFFGGRSVLSFLCAAAVPDIFIDTYFQMTAPLFGVSV